MPKNDVGLWIDHRKAVIVFVSVEGEKTRQIESDMEKHVRFSGGTAEVTEEDMRDRRFTNLLSKYYDEVIACIRDADSIVILGPGEAKGELQKRLEGLSLGKRIVAIETCDKMSDRQVAARVRQLFSKQ